MWPVTTKSALATLIAACTALLLPHASAASELPPCAPASAAQAGWEVSFKAACRDVKGERAGGSQILHLVSHQGALYAANGYWMDANNRRYGGSDPGSGWAQVLRLSQPDGAWAVDLSLGPEHMRAELLTSVTFTQDAQGRPLAAPATRLLAATFDSGGLGGISIFMRDDNSGTWARSAVIGGATGRRGEDNSVRTALVHRDRVTGREHLFLSVGVLGLFRADFEPGSPGRLVWSRTPEWLPERTRILGLAVADGALMVSDGQRVMRRIDGPMPRYEEIADFSRDMDARTPRETFSAIGGIRGLTALQGPVPGRQSLLLVWHSGRGARGCVFRLDPTPTGPWTRHPEGCLADLVSARLGLQVDFVIGAYNHFLALPTASGTTHVAGVQAFVSGRASAAVTAPNQRRAYGGYYAGAHLALRNAAGQWRLAEVNGRYTPGGRPLVAAYTAALSPFGGADGSRLYVGGYDPNFFPSTDTGWVYRIQLEALTGHTAATQ